MRLSSVLAALLGVWFSQSSAEAHEPSAYYTQEVVTSTYNTSTQVHVQRSTEPRQVVVQPTYVQPQPVIIYQQRPGFVAGRSYAVGLTTVTVVTPRPTVVVQQVACPCRH